MTELLLERAEARPPWEAAAHLVDWYAENPPPFSPLCLGHDLRRLYGDDGYELWREMMLNFHGREPELPATFEGMWESFDRSRANIDTMVISALAMARGQGFEIAHDVVSLDDGQPISPQVNAILDRLAAQSGARRAPIVFTLSQDEVARRAANARIEEERVGAWERLLQKIDDPDYEVTAVDLAEAEARLEQTRALAKQAVYMSQIFKLPQPQPDLIKRSADFVEGFVPPDYLVDGILQRRYFYSMTAATGAGKTAVAMLLTASVASGRPLGDIPVERGTVLYLAGENATDVQMRWLGITQELGLDPAQTDVHFLDATLDLSQNAERISHEVARKGIRPALVVVDTAAAYNSGDDENSNAQAGTYARLLRSLTMLPGGPCVVVLCHPTKRAGDDDLQPRGGGAFIAEVDGNIAVRKREAVVTAAPQGKFRGLENWSLSFALKTVYHPRLKDAKHRDIPTVVALPVSDGEKQQMAAVARRQEDLVLKTVETHPEASLRERAEHLCWRYAKSGKPDSAKVDRALRVLEKEKFIRKQRDGWELTTAGEKELNRLDLQKRDVALQPMFPSATVGATAAPPFPPARGH